MGVDTHFLPNILNCYDESSLELALRFRDQAQEAGGETELSAITIGEEHTELYLKTLQALGYDHPVRVCGEDEQLRYRPELVAQTIAAYARETGQQVLLLGSGGPPGQPRHHRPDDGLSAGVSPDFLGDRRKAGGGRNSPGAHHGVRPGNGADRIRPLRAGGGQCGGE